MELTVRTFAKTYARTAFPLEVVDQKNVQVYHSKLENYMWSCSQLPVEGKGRSWMANLGVTLAIPYPLF